MAARSSKGGGKGKQRAAGGTGAAKAASGKAFVLMLIGLPGCGKSWFSEQLGKKGWEVISQDTLGSREECEKQLDKAVRKGKLVVLDRVNVQAKERRMWINRVKTLGVTDIEVLLLDMPRDLCKTRVLTRKDHPTLFAREGFDPTTVIDRFGAIQRPEDREGFSACHVATTEEEVAVYLKAYLARK